MTIMGSKGFNVPTIPPDLRKEETIHHIADALEYLDKVANDIFVRISKRVGENKNYLHKINDRVNLAAARVDKLKGSNKATKVFACAKYPSEGELDSFQGMITDTDGLKSPKRSHYKVQEKHSPVDSRTIEEKLQFYHVHLNTKSKKDENQQGEGLGGLPRNVPSVSSLLLFNTTENPYKKYVMLDPLGVVTKTRAAIEEEEAGMAEAPSTIVHNEQMFRATAENFLYMPDIGVVPEIAVPDLLPNLPGVADDEAFSADQGPSIAPSVMGSLMPDLPDVGGVPDTLPPGPISSTGGGAVAESQSAPPPPPPIDSGPPPPPSSSAPPPPPPSSAPPPPPPPPPSDAAAPPPPPAAPPSAPTEAAGDTSAPSTGSGRDSLLDSIRKAGGASGAGLKSAKQRKLSNKKKKQEEKEQGSSAKSGGGGGGGGGDLMSDLFSKLTMRRKGISGTKSADNKSSDSSSASASSGGGSAMDKIAAMIPPPPVAESPEVDEEDNWD